MCRDDPMTRIAIYETLRPMSSGCAEGRRTCDGLGMGPLDQTLRLGVARLQQDDPHPERAAERLKRRRQLGHPRRQRQIATSLSYTPARGTRPGRRGDRAGGRGSRGSGSSGPPSSRSARPRPSGPGAWRPDRDPLGQMQSPDLGPVLDVAQLLPPRRVRQNQVWARVIESAASSREGVGFRPSSGVSIEPSPTPRETPPFIQEITGQESLASPRTAHGAQRGLLRSQSRYPLRHGRPVSCPSITTTRRHEWRRLSRAGRATSIRRPASDGIPNWGVKA